MAQATIPTWYAGFTWEVGHKVHWRGVVLVCCVGHKSPLDAVHPWAVDPSESQRPSEAGLYWAPDGMAACAELRRMLVDNRQSWGDYQRACVWFATGGAEKKKAA